MFASLRGRVKWSIDDVCVWTFSFADPDRAKLSAAGDKLKSMGYEDPEILDPASGDDDEGLFFLLVRKTEKHTVDSLLERHDELARLAKTLGVKSYDGVDPGPVTDAKDK